MPYWTRPVVYFGPLLSSRRVEAHMPHARPSAPSFPSFCSPRCRLISLTPSLVSCLSTCVLPNRTSLHSYSYSCSRCCTALSPDYILPVVDLQPGIHIHTPRNTSGWLTVDHPSHRHIDLIRFSDQTFSLPDSHSKPATNPKHTIVTATC
jgi:hypothetical protein